LAECEAQNAIVRPTLAKYSNVFGQHPVDEVAPASVTHRLNDELTIRVTDREGHPVAGAAAGVISRLGDLNEPDERVLFFEKPKDHPIHTDAAGKLATTVERVFSPYGLGSYFLDLGEAPLVVRDDSRGLCALDELKFSEFGGGKVHNVILQPACHVTGEVTSIGEEGSGTLTEVDSYAYKPGHVGIRAIFSDCSKQPNIDLLVPPGDYGIYATARHCEAAFRYLHIEPGRRTVNLQIDLPRHHSADALVGEIAPELREIKGWKNSKPLTLASLRGKVALLDFWGYWCGPCIGSMPELMRLHDQYSAKGLVVIAIHDGSVHSIDEMDQKTAGSRAKAWGGRDLPFPIALDGGGDHRIPGTAEFALGATTAAYSVHSFPSTFLIGPDGKVVAMLDLRGDEKDRKAIEAMIEKELRSIPK